MSHNVENVGMFRELVESSDNIIVVTDQSFNIRYVSSAVVRAFNIEPVKMLGRSVFDFVTEDRARQWKACLETNVGSFSEEISLMGPHGKAYYDVEVMSLRQQQNFSGLALKLHDITEKKIKENDLIRSNQQLDQVIYKTTHDLKAPLMSALGLVQLAERSSEGEKGRYIELIKKSLLKLDSFIEEMNDFFRNEKLAVQRERILIKQLIEEEIDDLVNLPEFNNVTVSFEIEGDIDFYSDSIRVRTVLANILSNAIKYSDQKKNEPFIRIYVSLNQEFCQIRIVDNGIGIEKNSQDKIFDLFFRATTHSQGTGLGLFIVKDTIQKLQGTIEVSSMLGEGTTFLIRIPNKIHQPTTVE
jgi:PAS domain S-box-containing protein